MLRHQFEKKAFYKPCFVRKSIDRRGAAKQQEQFLIRYAEKYAYISHCVIQELQEFSAEQFLDVVLRLAYAYEHFPYGENAVGFLIWKHQRLQEREVECYIHD